MDRMRHDEIWDKKGQDGTRCKMPKRKQLLDKMGQEWARLIKFDEVGLSGKTEGNRKR